MEQWLRIPDNFVFHHAALACGPSGRDRLERALPRISPQKPEP